MTFSASDNGIFMKKISNSEKGQAIVEMTISMIAIMVVFLGIIFAFAIGSTNIENLLSCRKNADNCSYSQIYGSNNQTVLTWTEGKDGRMYTNDDVAIISSNDKPDLFKGELQSDSIDLVNGFGGSYVKNNFANDLSGTDAIFLNAANLTSYSLFSDPYEAMNIENLRGAFSKLIANSDLEIHNSIYMPIMNNTSEKKTE